MYMYSGYTLSLLFPTNYYKLHTYDKHKFQMVPFLGAGHKYWYKHVPTHIMSSFVVENNVGCSCAALIIYNYLCVSVMPC